MNLKEIILGLCLFSVALAGMAQDNAEKPSGAGDTAMVNNLLQQSKEQFNNDPAKSISLAMQAKDLAEKISFIRGEALALKNVGLGYYYQGKYLETLEYWNESLKIFEQLKDEIGVANLLNNIAAIYADQGDDAKGLEYALQSLKLSEKTGDKLRILSALNTIGSIYYNKKATWDKALDYLLKALPLCEEIGNNEAYGIISENIGEIYFEKGDDAKALNYFEKSIKVLGNSANSPFAYNGIGKVYLKEGNFEQALNYHNKALAIAEKLNGKLHIVRSLYGIANVYIKKNDYSTALNYYTRATAIAEEINAATNLKDLYQEMAAAYSKTADYKKAFKYQSLYANIKDTLYKSETDKKLVSLQFDFDLQKKQGEINLLTKDKALTALQLNRQKLAKRTLMVGLVLVFLIALLIFRNYRAKVKTNKILDRQKDEIEHLLLNILPSEVANELQVNGYAKPRNYESVSVMFTDFKGFTTIADTLSPHEVVAELNDCFTAFDEIMEKFKLEKIKTIGDSYMCAGGIPVSNEEHPVNMIRAGMEICDYMYHKNEKRKAAGLPPWELRIGMHVGQVVAGVVGKNKYAYDIWGSTVNIASRMESNGEPGRINISSAAYELVKEKYECTYRGKIYAKNVGEIDMYFVQSEKKHLHSKEDRVQEVLSQA
jgi:class 3 adenylate cyclase/tetratricopeptide (TPR) repeat protein